MAAILFFVLLQIPSSTPDLSSLKCGFVCDTRKGVVGWLLRMRMGSYTRHPYHRFPNNPCYPVSCE